MVSMTHSTKLHRFVSNSFSIVAQTDRHTDTHTHMDDGKKIQYPALLAQWIINKFIIYPWLSDSNFKPIPIKSLTGLPSIKNGII